MRARYENAYKIKRKRAYKVNSACKTQNCAKDVKKSGLENAYKTSNTRERKKCLKKRMQNGKKFVVTFKESCKLLQHFSQFERNHETFLSKYFLLPSCQTMLLPSKWSHVLSF